MNKYFELFEITTGLGKTVFHATFTSDGYGRRVGSVHLNPYPGRNARLELERLADRWIVSKEGEPKPKLSRFKA